MNRLVLGLDHSGHPNTWLSWEEGVTAIYKNEVSWSMGDEVIYHGGTSRLTGLESTISVPSIIALKGVHKGKRRTPPLNNRNLFGRDRNICCYCGEHFSSDRLTRDHIIPMSRGGTNTWMNVTSSCCSCNCTKDNKLLSECSMELLYLPYVPDRCEHLILANRKILADQLEFIMAHLPKHSRLL